MRTKEGKYFTLVLEHTMDSSSPNMNMKENIFRYRLLHKQKKGQIKWNRAKCEKRHRANPEKKKSKKGQKAQRRRNPRNENEWEKPKGNEIKERERQNRRERETLKVNEREMWVIIKWEFCDTCMFYNVPLVTPRINLRLLFLVKICSFLSFLRVTLRVPSICIIDWWFLLRLLSLFFFYFLF